MYPDQHSHKIPGFMRDYSHRRLIFEEFLGAVVIGLCAIALVLDFFMDRTAWAANRVWIFWCFEGLCIGFCASFCIMGWGVQQRRRWAYLGVWSECSILVVLLVISAATKPWHWTLLFSHIFPLIGSIDKVISIGRYLRSRLR